MTNSVSYRFFNKIRKDFKESFIINFFIKIFTYIGGLFEQSFILGRFIYKNNSNDKEEKIIKNNIFLKIINKILNLIGGFIFNIKNDSLFIKFITYIFNLDLYYLFNSFIIVLFSFLNSKIILDFFMKSLNPIIIVLVFTINVLVISKILFSKIKGSIYIKLINRVISIKKERVLSLSTIFFVLIGVGITTLSYKVDNLLLLKGCLGFLAVYLIFRYFEIGIFILVFSIPFLSDQSSVIILLITIMSGFLKWVIDKDFKFNKNQYNNILLALVLIFTINTFLSIDINGSIRDFVINVLSIILIYMMINNLKKEKTLFIIFDLIILAVSIAAMYGLYQYKIGIPMGSGWVDPKSNITIRIFSTFENPNLFAEYLILAIPITITRFINRDIKYKLVYLIAFVIQLSALVLTFSRGGWLGLIIGLGFFVLLLRKDLIIKLIPFGLISLFFIPSSIMMRFKSIGNLADSSNYYRFQIWQKSVQIVKDFYLTGVGLGYESFRNISNLYIKDFTPYHAHNTYLELAIEIGLLGLIIFLVLLVKGIIDVKKQKLCKNKIYTAGLVSGIIALFVHGIAEHVLYNPKIVFQFWVVLGLLITMSIRFMKVSD